MKRTIAPSTLDEAVHRLYTCPECKWFRDIKGSLKGKEYIHPIYGRTSYFDAALKDIGRHKCAPHRISQRVAKGK